MMPDEKLQGILNGGDGDDEEGRHGGASIGKAPNSDRDFDSAVRRLMGDYNGLDGQLPRYNETMFERRFAVPRDVLSSSTINVCSGRFQKKAGSLT